MEGLPNLTESYFPGLGKTVKLPKSMAFTAGPSMPLIRDGMFNDLSGTFSPTAASGQHFTSLKDEETKAMASTSVKKGGLIRKKVIASSKTTRAVVVDENAMAGEASEQIEKLKKLIKKQQA